MKYTMPELIAVGTAAALVRGGLPGQNDNGASLVSRAMPGVVLDLDE